MAVTQPDDCPALVPGDVPCHPGSSECGDGSARPAGRPGALAERRLSAIAPANIVTASVIFTAACADGCITARRVTEDVANFSCWLIARPLCLIRPIAGLLIAGLAADKL